MCVCVSVEEKQYLEKDSQTQALVNSTSSQTEPLLTSQDHKPSRNDRHGQETQVDLNTIKAKIVTASTSSAEEEISSENRNSSNSLNTPPYCPSSQEGEARQRNDRIYTILLIMDSLIKHIKPNDLIIKCKTPNMNGATESLQKMR